LQGKAAWRDNVTYAMMMEVSVLEKGLILCNTKGSPKGMCGDRLFGGGPSLGQVQCTDISDQLNPW
jgi:hypothetical protein